MSDSRAPNLATIACGDHAWSSAAVRAVPQVMAGIEASVRGREAAYAFLVAGRAGPGGSPTTGRITLDGRTLKLDFHADWEIGAMVEAALPSFGKEDRLAALLRTTPWLKSEALVDGSRGDGLDMVGSLAGGAYPGASDGALTTAHFTTLEGLAKALEQRDAQLRQEFAKRLLAAVLSPSLARG